MLLNGEKIKERGLLQEAKDVNYRAASYDLRIGKIITTSDEQEVVKYTLPPQGIVEIISKESVKLPFDVAGYAMVKTRLCNEGVLALNIGIIDPGYQGPLSSALINFGKSDVHLRAGDIFLRLTFHETSPQSKVTAIPPVAKDDYLESKKNSTKKYLSETFLNIRDTSEKVAEQVLEKWRKSLLVWVPILAFLLAFFALLVNLGSSWGGRFALSKDQVKSEVENDIRQESISKLEERVKELEAKAAKPQPTTSQIEDSTIPKSSPQLHENSSSTRKRDSH